MSETKQTKQRIKLRIYKHPVKHDATIVEFAPDGSWFVVRFDGPLEDLKLWRYSDTIAVDKEPVNGSLVGHTQIWEIL